MGFGVLFFGYLLNLSIFKQFTDVMCFLLILYALLKLYRFNRGFKQAMYSCIPLVIFGFAYFVYGICDLLGIIQLVSIPENNVSIATSYYALISGVLQIVLYTRLLSGIQEIGRETGVPVIEFKAARNRFLTFIYYIPYIFTEWQFEFGSTLGKIAGYAFLPVLIFGVIYHVMNLSLIHNCYVWICLEGEEDMQRKKSRFAFINKLNEKEDKIHDRLVERKREQKKEKADKKKK